MIIRTEAEIRAEIAVLNAAVSKYRAQLDACGDKRGAVARDLAHRLAYANNALFTLLWLIDADILPPTIHA
jgi:hypothetical protein